MTGAADCGVGPWDSTAKQGGSLTQQQQKTPAPVIWGSTRAPTEMELALQLTAFGLQLTAVGCNRRWLGCNGLQNWRAVLKQKKTSARLGTALLPSSQEGEGTVIIPRMGAHWHVRSPMENEIKGQHTWSPWQGGP